MGQKERELVEQLYRQYFQKLFLYADAQLNDPERARDVVQDTFHEAIRHADALGSHEKPGGWLMRTLQNKLRESERARRRYLLRFLSLDSDFPDGVFPEGGGLPEEPPDAGPAPPGESALEKIERALSPEEYRLLNGRGPAHKKGAQRLELIPSAMLGEIVLHTPRDLLQFLPDGLPERFTSGDLQKSIRLNARSISYLILVLRRLELIEQVGKQERFHLYQIRA